MNKKIKPEDNAANQQNANKGFDGNNLQHDKVHGNRGKQIQHNPKKKGK